MPFETSRLFSVHFIDVLKVSTKLKNRCQFSSFNEQVSIAGACTENFK